MTAEKCFPAHRKSFFQPLATPNAARYHSKKNILHFSRSVRSLLVVNTRQHKMYILYALCGVYTGGWGWMEWVEATNTFSTIPWKTRSAYERKTSKFSHFQLYTAREVLGWLALFAKRTHIIVGRTKEKMLPCDSMWEWNGGCFFRSDQNYICVIAESIFLSAARWQLDGIFCVGGRKSEREIDTQENISWNRKWKCTRQSAMGRICLWWVSGGSFNASFR